MEPLLQECVGLFSWFHIGEGLIGDGSWSFDGVLPVAVLIHTCKRELSPAHLVCPWRHNA
jgi:hypothetical protein